MHAIVIGEVQGVSFRYYTVIRARELNIYGTVRNLPDISKVEVFAEGEKENMDVFLEWLHQGPPGASVDLVEFEWLPDRQRYPDFRTVR